jgi:hypothetical protein
MNSFIEQDSIDHDNPEIERKPLPLSGRAAKLGPLVSQGARSELTESFPIPRPALLARKAIDESARRTHDAARRAALLSVAARTSAVAGVVAAAVLLFVFLKPASRQLVANPTSSETTGIASRLEKGDVESTSALAEVKGPVTSPPSQDATQDRSQQLLQRFLQWREKANTSEASH